MWDGGNVAHYAAEQPRVLIDGIPRRAPWIDLGDLRSKGAVVVWTDGDPERDAGGLPDACGRRRRCSRRSRCRSGAASGELTVGWAILRPQPAFASALASDVIASGSRSD